MAKINPDTRAQFFPGKNTINNSPINPAKNTYAQEFLNRNDIEKQNEIREKTQSDVQVTIPDKIKDFARIKKAALNAPDIDNSEKIKNLKSQIEKGEYTIDFDQLAEKILEKEI
jgi:flagellar biosynthesis anti-sigma factor FlgM